VRVDLLLHLGLTVEQLLHRLVVHRLGERHVDLLELREQGALRRDRFLDVSQHGLRRVELRLLRQEANARARMRPGFALELLVDAGHDAQQDDFPAPLGPRTPIFAPG
jgi:hypothetical protein